MLENIFVESELTVKDKTENRSEGKQFIENSFNHLFLSCFSSYDGVNKVWSILQRWFNALDNGSIRDNQKWWYHDKDNILVYINNLNFLSGVC